MSKVSSEMTPTSQPRASAALREGPGPAVRRGVRSQILVDEPLAESRELMPICELAGLYWDKSLCTDCGRCLWFCPRGVFRRVRDSHVRVHGRLCIPCGRCLGKCPSGAIGFKGS